MNQKRGAGWGFTSFLGGGGGWSTRENWGGGGVWKGGALPPPPSVDNPGSRLPGGTSGFTHLVVFWRRLRAVMWSVGSVVLEGGGGVPGRDAMGGRSLWGRVEHLFPCSQVLLVSFDLFFSSAAWAWKSLTP